MSFALLLPVPMLLGLDPQPADAHATLPVALVALGGATVVVVVAAAVPARTEAGENAARTAGSWEGRLSTPQRAVRALSVLMLLTVVVAGRLGVRDDLENLAPAFAIGVAWPLLFAGSLVLGTLWRWLDPWDAIARVLAPGDATTPAAHVWPAVVLAVPWLWFLGAYSRTLDPRSVGAALAAYTVVTVAACLALGRVRWLSSGEPLGLLLSWVGLLPRRQLRSWTPPRGAETLLGVVIGGLVFGAVRRTSVWTPLHARDDEWVFAAVGLVASCALMGAAAGLEARAGRTGAQRAVVSRVLVPAVASLVIAVALARNRLFNSVQLLPGLVGDPLGRGWDLLGSPTEGLREAPLGVTGLVALQLAVIGVLHLVAAVTGARQLPRDQRLSVIGVLAVSVALSMTAVVLH